MKYIVYLTTNLKNKKIYVGVHGTKNPDSFDGYIGCGVIITQPSTYKNSKTPFQYAVNKYGVDSFRRTTLKVFDVEEEAYYLESEIVTKEFINRADTYNAVLGGGIPPCYERNISQYDLDGNFITEWESLAKASSSLNCTASALGNAIKFMGSSVGYFWDYNKVNKLDIKNYTNNSNKQNVYKYGLDGKLIKIYDSITQASYDTKEIPSTIGRAIQGEYLVIDAYYSLQLFDTFIPKETIKIRGSEIHLYEIDGTYFKSFNKPIECAKFFGLKSSSEISKALRLGRLFKNFQVSLEKVDNMKKLENLNNKAKAVGRYSLDGELLQSYKTIGAACEEYGTSVQKVLRDQQKQCKGFIFKYL